MSDINEYLKSPRILTERTMTLTVIYIRIFRQGLDALHMTGLVCKDTCETKNALFIEQLKSPRILIERMMTLPVICNQILRAVLDALHTTGPVCKDTCETENARCSSQS